MGDQRAGFREIAHTADWALQVWAPDLAELFALAAQGMAALMEQRLVEGERQVREMTLEGADEESLLVAFLTELLYLRESEGLGFDQFDVDLAEGQLKARAWGAPLAGQAKEIKAVTYHNLAIRRSQAGCAVTIVFDV